MFTLTLRIVMVMDIVVWCSYIFNTFFWHSIRFPQINLSCVTKKFKVFFTDVNTIWFCNIPEEKYFLSLRILYLFIRPFVSLFLDIASTFSDRLFDLFLTSTCFALFEVTFLFKVISLSLKSVFFTK